MTLEEKKFCHDILVCISSIDEHLEYRKIYDEYLKSKTKSSRKRIRDYWGSR